jgi:hypothetical protein
MGSSRQTTTQSVPQFYQDFMTQDLFPAAREVAGQEFTPYEGQFTAGVSPLSMGAQPFYEQIGNIAGMTPEDYAAMTQANMSPFQNQVIDAALARAQRERDIARTGEMAQITQAGAFGNERRGVFEAERQAAFDIGQQQMIADLMQQGYNQAQAATMAQLQMGQGAAGQAAAGMQQLGSLEQLTQQAELDALYQEFMREQNLPLQQLGALVSASGGAQIPMTSTQSSSPGFAGILGAVGAAGQGLGAMFSSDRRLKRDIRHVATENGIRYYRWEWNEEAKRIGAADTPPMGVIAQELAETHPHLVQAGEDGYLRVDYSGLAKEQGKVA